MLASRHALTQLFCLAITACTLSHELAERTVADAGGTIRRRVDDGGAAPLDGSRPSSCTVEDATAMVCPTALCDSAPHWYWNGDTCFPIECGACMGADCARGLSSQADCVAAHATCRPSLCTASGGAWLWWAEECGDYVCGHSIPADCIVGYPACDCGPSRRFDAVLGCVTDPTCPPTTPMSRQALCLATSGTWDGICCDTVCGEVCPDPCVSPACNCGPSRIFDPVRGCIESTRCHDRMLGETCTTTESRCATGTICCQHCSGIGCTSTTCTTPVCGGRPMTDECGNNLFAP